MLQLEHDLHHDLPAADERRSVCAQVRRYAVVTLTNVTFANQDIKRQICASDLINILVSQLEACPENFLRVTAQLYRNLAWRADKRSRKRLSDSGVVGVLIRRTMNTFFERRRSDEDAAEVNSTLKVSLAALWNLSSHCGKNKVSSFFICCASAGPYLLIDVLLAVVKKIDCFGQMIKQ